MVDAKKHKKQQNKYLKEMEAAEKELPDIDEKFLFMVRYFYTAETLTGAILEVIPEKFEKEFDELDVMNVAIFTLHGIISAAISDDVDMKEADKDKLCGMVGNEYNLNEWLYTTAAETKAYDNALYECIKSGKLDKLDDVVEKAVKEANYTAWKNELKVIQRKTSAKDRIAEIKGGA